MARLLILVEGQTEERFVTGLLRDHLSEHGVYPAATILVTKFVATGPRHKGGVSSWEKIERDLRNLLRDSGAAGITTLLDYYQLPSNTPGMSDRPNGQPSARVHTSNRRSRRRSTIGGCGRT